MAGLNPDGLGRNRAYDDLESESHSTEELLYALNNTGYSNRLSGRPLVSTQNRDLTVGTDTDTIQEALNQIPVLLRHNFVIRVPDGVYDEDLLIPPYMLEDTAGVDSAGAGSDEGATQNPWIIGNTSTPSNVKVNSITISSTQGAISPIIEGFNPTGVIPYSDEPTSIAAFGCQNVSLRHITLAGTSANVGVLCYSSGMTIRGGFDWGNDDVVRGVEMKHNGHLAIDPYDGVTTGTVQDYLVRNDDGSVVVIEETDATGGDGLINNVHGVGHHSGRHEYYPLPAGVSLTGTTEQTVSSDISADTYVQFDDTEDDIYGNWDATNHEFNIPKPGAYEVNFNVQWLNPSDTTRIQAGISHNGVVQFVEKNGIIGDNPSFGLSRRVHSTSGGGAIRFVVRHNEGTDLTINLDNPNTTFASIQRVR